MNLQYIDSTVKNRLFIIIYVFILLLMIRILDIEYEAEILEQLTFVTLDAFLIFGFGIIVLKNRSSIPLLFVLMFISSLSMLYFGYDHTGLIGPDEKLYYHRLIQQLDTPWLDALTKDIIAISEGHILFSSSYPVFTLLTLPYYRFMDGVSPELIYFFNLLIYFISLSFIYSVFPRKSKKTDFIFLLFLCSPYIRDLSLGFGKDLISIGLCVLTVKMFLSRKWLFFLFLLLLSTALRPYSPLIIITFLVIMLDKNKLLVSIAFISFAGTSMFVGFKSAIFKLIGTSFYFYFMPNPALSSSFEFGMIPVFIEFIFLSALILLTIINLSCGFQKRKMFLELVCLNVIASSILIVIGYISVNANSELVYQSSAITPGDNVYRKQLFFFMTAILIVMKYSVKANLKTDKVL